MKVLNKEFWSFCEWLIDNKLSIRFRVDKTKTNYFILKKKPCQNFCISYRDSSRKQHDTVDYLGCYLDSAPSLNNCNTRAQMALDTPICKTNKGQKGVSFLGPRIWNKLSSNI